MLVFGPAYVATRVGPRHLTAGHLAAGQLTKLHGDGDDGTTAVTVVMGLHFMTDTAVVAGMGTAVTVVPL